MDSPFIQTSTIPYDELKEDPDKKGDKKSNPADKNVSTVIEEPISCRKILRFSLLHLGWIAGMSYFCFVIFYYVHLTKFFDAEPFIEPCNGTNVIPVYEYKQLKEDISFIKKDITDMSITIRHSLFEENPETLQKNYNKYVTRYDDLSAILKYQREQRFECYKVNTQKYLENYAQIVLNVISIFYVFLTVVSCEYGYRVSRSISTERDIRAAKAALSMAVTLSVFNAWLIMLSAIYPGKETFFKKFPL